MKVVLVKSTDLISHLKCEIELKSTAAGAKYITPDANNTVTTRTHQEMR